MRKLLFLVIPLFLGAENLKDVLAHAMKHNELVGAKALKIDASAKAVDAHESSYFPKIDVGGFYKRDDEPSPLQAGDIYAGFAKIGVALYDGGVRHANIEGAKRELQVAAHERDALQKDLALRIVQDYFALQTLLSSLQAREEAQNSLRVQLQRMQQFYEARLATKDDVERIQASYDTNVYEMQAIKFEIVSLKKKIELVSGLRIGNFERSSLRKDETLTSQNLSNIDALASRQMALLSYADAIDAYYYPSIQLEDTYTVYGYDRENAFAKQVGAQPLSEQNTLMISISMRLFDYGMSAKNKEVQELEAQSLALQKNYAIQEQSMQQELSLERIKTARLRIQSASSALEAAQSAFVTIEQKYDSGIVDYVVYLDTLTQKMQAKALYEGSLNELEVAYAMYYYYAGKNIEEFVE